MKICWDNIENLYVPKRPHAKCNFRNKNHAKYMYRESCKNCGEPFLAQPQSKAKFCDKSCKVIYENNKREYKSGKEHPLYGTKNPDASKRMKENNPVGIGKNNSNWKGGVTPKNRLIRTSTKYTEWRLSVYERDKFTCQECKERGGSLNAHHIKTFADYPELRFEVSNGITLCEDCHKKIKGKEKLYEEKYYSIILYGVVTGRMLGYG